MDSKEIEKKHPDYHNECRRAMFCRDAASGKFGDVFFRAMGLGHGDEITEDKYLLRWDKENPYSFTRRARGCSDPDYSKKIITFFDGSFAHAPQSLEIKANSGGDELTSLLKDDIDFRGNDFVQFAHAVASDLMIAGRSWIVGDVVAPKDDKGERTEGKGRPYVMQIAREDVWDWRDGVDGKLEFFKYCRRYSELDGLKIVDYSRVYIWTRKEWASYIRRDGDKDWSLEERKQNQLGEIPAKRIDMGTEARSIIENVAKFQLGMMNVSSEVRNALSLQCLIMLVLPEWTIAKLSDAAKIQTREGETVRPGIKLAVNTLIPVPDEEKGKGPRFLTPEVGSMDAQFKLIEYFRQTLFSASSVYAAKDAPESGEAKRIEFTQSVAVLSAARRGIQETVVYVLDLAIRAAGYDGVEVHYEIENRFEPVNVKEILENLITADAAGLGATVMKKQRQIARAALPGKYTEQELADSDDEIDEISEMGGGTEDDAGAATDRLGKTPLALQQLANAAADAAAQGAVELAKELQGASKKLVQKIE